MSSLAPPTLLPPPLNKLNKLKCYQLNLHKSFKANSNMALLADPGPSIYLLQEPNFNKKHKLTGIPHQIKTFTGGNCPRTAIAVTPELEAWAMPEYSNRDITTITIKGQDNIIFCSLYCDINENITSNTELVALELFCRTNPNVKLIIGADTNAHSELWGLETNQRGEQFENFLAPSRLELINTGHEPTYIVPGRNSYTAIDSTFASFSIADQVSEWHVANAETYSDHKLIKFTLNFQADLPPPSRNFKKVDWQLFHTLIEKKSEAWTPPKIWTNTTLDVQCAQLNFDIDQILDKNWKKHQVKMKNKILPTWWTE